MPEIKMKSVQTHIMQQGGIQAQKHNKLLQVNFVVEITENVSFFAHSYK